MEHIKGIENFTHNGPCAVTIGKFDALHRGHRHLIDNIVNKKSQGMYAVAIIFSTSPRIALGKTTEDAKFIITKSERRNMLKELGIDCLLELVFDENMIRMEPEDFVSLLCDKLNMKHLCVGEDFKFGHFGKGDTKLLSELSVKRDFSLCAAKKLTYEDEVISSTRIRDEIIKGHLAKVNDMLGYDFFIHSMVVHGNRIGRTIDFPTINMVPTDDKILPPFGVYATMTLIGEECLFGMTNIGVRPTVNSDSTKLTIETHLFDFEGDLYEKDAIVKFLDFVRPERKFSDIEELKLQIRKDEKYIKELLA